MVIQIFPPAPSVFQFIWCSFQFGSTNNIFVFNLQEFKFILLFKFYILIFLIELMFQPLNFVSSQSPW